MATRFYLRHTADTTNITPTPDAAWGETSSLVRAYTNTTKSSDTITTVSNTSLDRSDHNLLLRQYITTPLNAGQVITGSQNIQFVIRASETNNRNNLYTAIGIRVINGSTVQKTILNVTRDNIELATTLTNRNFTATSNSGNYTTVAGDQIVIEIGYGGNPEGQDTPDASMSFGDSSATDLVANDTGTLANNPWVEFSDTFTSRTYTASGGATSGGAATTSITGTAVTHTYSASGGATSGGAATTYKVDGNTNVYEYSASGGAVSGGSAASADNEATITVTLKQGATVIATWVTQRVSPEDITNYSFTLTEAQLASISYPASDLTLQIDGTTGFDDLRVYEISLTAPSSSKITQISIAIPNVSSNLKSIGTRSIPDKVNVASVNTKTVATKFNALYSKNINIHTSADIGNIVPSGIPLNLGQMPVRIYGTQYDNPLIHSVIYSVYTSNYPPDAQPYPYQDGSDEPTLSKTEKIELPFEKDSISEVIEKIELDSELRKATAFSEIEDAPAEPEPEIIVRIELEDNAEAEKKKYGDYYGIKSTSWSLISDKIIANGNLSEEEISRCLSEMMRISNINENITMMSNKDMVMLILHIIDQEWAKDVTGVVGQAMKAILRNLMAMPASTDDTTNYILSDLDLSHIFGIIFESVYTYTQESLSSLGVSVIPAYRVVSYSGVQKAGDFGIKNTVSMIVDMDILSSFSDSESFAASMIDKNRAGFFLSAKIPVERIFSTSLLGIGDVQGSEMIIIGKETEVLAKVFY